MGRKLMRFAKILECGRVLLEYGRVLQAVLLEYGRVLQVVLFQRLEFLFLSLAANPCALYVFRPRLFGQVPARTGHLLLDVSAP
jgi:hypothetical protein